MKNLFKLINEVVITSFFLVAFVVGKAQDQQSVTLNPYFDPKDKEILLNIDENTGELKGVISLQQPWVDKAFSKDGKYLYTVSNTTLSKIDLKQFIIIDEQKYFEQRPKEEWDDKNSFLDESFRNRSKVSSNGTVIFFKRSERYGELAKEIIFLEKERDKECELIKDKGGDWYTEWKRVFDNYNSKIKPLFDEKLSLIGEMEVCKFTINGNTKVITHCSSGAYIELLDDNLFILEKIKKTSQWNLRKINLSIDEITEIDITELNNNMSFDISIMRLVKFPKSLVLQCQPSYSSTTKVGIAYLKNNSVVEQSSIKQFNSWDEYTKYWQKEFMSNSSTKFEVSYKSISPLEKPKKHYLEIPNANSMKKKEYQKAYDEYLENKKVEDDKYKLALSKYYDSKEEFWDVIKFGENEEPYLRIEKSGIIMAYIFDGNKLILDRKFELELYDLENKKTIWITELDY